MKRKEPLRDRKRLFLLLERRSALHALVERLVRPRQARDDIECGSVALRICAMLVRVKACEQLAILRLHIRPGRVLRKLKIRVGLLHIALALKRFQRTLNPGRGIHVGRRSTHPCGAGLPTPRELLLQLKVAPVFRTLSLTQFKGELV